MELIKGERKASHALHAATLLALQLQTSERRDMPASLISHQVPLESAIQLIWAEPARGIGWIRQPQRRLEVSV